MFVFVFFFQEKAGDGISGWSVGLEMCIRDKFRGFEGFNDLNKNFPVGG